MKKITLFALSISLCSLGFSQIPNAGFETWITETQTATNFVIPQHWTSSDELVYAFDNGYAGASVSKTTNVHSGSFATLCQNVVNHGDTVNGVIYSCDSLVQLLTFSFGGKMCGFPCTIRPASLQAYYEFTGVGGDSAAFGVYMTKWNTVSNKRDTIVYTQYTTNVNASTYTFINIPLTYLNNLEYPDSALVAVGIRPKNGKTAHLGTTFYIDDLSFNGSKALGVDNLQVLQNNLSFYPNPFDKNAILSVSTSVKLNNANLEIYNMLGETVRTLNNIKDNNISIERGDLKEGIYFYRLTNQGEVIGTGKFMVK